MDPAPGVPAPPDCALVEEGVCCKAGSRCPDFISLISFLSLSFPILSFTIMVGLSELSSRTSRPSRRADVLVS
jgi:hypothetical protein